MRTNLLNLVSIQFQFFLIIKTYKYLKLIYLLLYLDDDSYYDDNYNELDNSLYNLAITCIEKIALCFI